MSSAQQSHAPGQRALDIVVVDDEAENAQMLAQLLDEKGHTTRVCTLGIEALQMIEERTPDVLVLDLGLPEVDGYELARFLRTRYGERIRLIAHTGFNTREARALADWAGFDAFVAKPLRIEAIEKVLRA